MKNKDIQLLEEAYASMYQEQRRTVESVLAELEQELFLDRLYFSVSDDEVNQIKDATRHGDIETIIDIIIANVSDQNGGEPRDLENVAENIRNAFEIFISDNI